jgi:adenylate cyclase
LTIDDVLERAGVSVEQVREWFHDLGWPDPTSPGARFNEFDVRLLEIFGNRIPMDVLPRAVVADFLRTASATVGAIAESMLNTLRIGLDQPLREGGASPVEVATSHREILQGLLPDFFEAIQVMFRHSVVLGAATDLTVNRGGEIWSERTMVFVDIVDYSTLAQGMGAQLRDVLDHFELAVSSAATDFGGRLVKLLGDGAMLTFAGRDAAVSAAIAIVRDGSLPPCRAGVATGQVMLRHADFFGSVVNLASRLSSIVDAGEVAVDDALDLAGAERMEPTRLKGVDTPVTPYRVSPV